ncbi:hypothetical protein MOBT1_001731 [Malassezia obtusa]|uniref:Uncharacterized protein n=1 Tax=Malassezia obtusa TaxID=76774 RepID=A0AAF0E3V4_9BASI|nr:hypothetical protein MOBT1_001731 [Malassezia obtusa]
MALNAAERAARGALALRAHERIVYQQEGCVFTITATGGARAPLRSPGVCLVTNQRLVALGDVQKRSALFDSLDVPLPRLGIGRYRLPLFSAAYYEMEVPLQVTPDAAPEHALLVVHFHEGGADAFRHALARARDEWEQYRRDLEALRTGV